MASARLQRGGNLALTKISPGISSIYVALGWEPRGDAAMEVDASAFALADNGKVRGDYDLVFYNNPRIPEGSIAAVTETSPAGAGDDAQIFALALDAVPEEIQKIAFTVTIYEGQQRGQSFGMLSTAWARVVNPADRTELVRFELPLAGTPETAMIFCEIYRHAGEWKFKAVGQGYVGGLEPLATGYGVDVGEEPVESAQEEQPERSSDISPPASPIPPEPPSSAAEPSAPPSAVPTPEDSGTPARAPVAELENTDPELADLVRKAGVALEAHTLQGHQAKLAICLDISGSMQGLYHKGSIDVLVRRVLALGLCCDNTGEIEVFLFGAKAYHAGTVNIGNYRDFVADMLRQYSLESGTYYGKVLQLVREHYRTESFFGQVPVYVLFATDGDTSDRQLSERQVIEASKEGIFWQFMAIGEPRAEKRGFFSKLLSSSFDFLTDLETRRNRLVDNTHFFLVRDPAQPGEEGFYQLLMAGYPSWLKAARAKGVFR